MRLQYLAMAAALALSACASGPSAPPAAGTSPPTSTAPAGPSTADTITIAGTKGLIIAELAYNSAARSVLLATQAGAIRPGTPLAETIRNLNATASHWLAVARVARTGAEQAAAVANAIEAITMVQNATPTTTKDS